MAHPTRYNYFFNLFILDCLTYGGPRNWTDIPNECQFPFEISGTTFDQCAVFGKNQPWCPTKVNGANVPTTTDWGWCGDCSGKMNPKCSSANHKTLTDFWRRIPGGKHAGSNSDQSLPKGWYRFKSGGHDAVIPEGSAPTGMCLLGLTIGWEILETETNMQSPFLTKFLLVKIKLSD